MKLKIVGLFAVLSLMLMSSIVAATHYRDYRDSRSKSYVRFLHASPDAPEVDIYVKDGPALFEDVEFEEVEGYIRVRSGTYDLEVRVAGTDNVVLELDDVRLSRWRSYTVVATGLVGEGTLNAVLLRDRRR